MNLAMTIRPALAALLLALPPALLLADAGRPDGLAPGPSIIGIDHMPTVVRQLDRASDDYRKLGFALKPGGLHANGLHNTHVKFEDGSGIELICPPASPGDELATRYAEFLQQGEGPAYIALHARNTEELHAALRSSGLRLKPDDADPTLDEPLLDFLFFVQDNRSPTDLPEHFAHANSATAMTGVWLALDEARSARMRRLLTALGARQSRARLLAPDPQEAEVFAVQNGRVVIFPQRGVSHVARPVVGVEFHVRDLSSTPCARRAEENSVTNSIAPKRCLVAPAQTHGTWLEFHE